jgi:subtilisin family serine protease
MPAPAARHWIACLLLALMPLPAAAAGPDWSAQAGGARMIVVAVTDKPDFMPAAGASPRGYDSMPSYSGGDRAVALAERLSADYGLQEVSAWNIEPLRLRCMVFALPDGADRDTVLQQLGRDRRVRLAQPLHEFQTFGTPVPETPATATPTPAKPYNDPYLSLQHNFTAIDAAAAQRWTRGGGVRIALIDTGLDAAHPDLAGRIAEQRDFVGAAAGAAAERHGTEVAGVISAVADNRLGIVGVAPDAQLLAYRACWPQQENSSSSRCNSYTLALALGAAIAADARIINLSLGGPADPLLQQLVQHAVRRGAIVVGAVPPDRRMDGFPIGVPGVIAVAAAEDPRPAAPALLAPGRDILTLEPGGSFDYASGSSLATAQVSGAIALLLSLKPGQDAASLYALLSSSQRDAAAPIDICAAVARLRPAASPCASTASPSAEP